MTSWRGFNGEPIKWPGPMEEWLARNHYWQYQVPFVGQWMRGSDANRYWQDYYKTTGFMPKYPGMRYDAMGSSAIQGAQYLTGKFFEEMYK